MTIKVLVVDDSNFFRRRVSEIINASPYLEVIATANNGKEAIDMVVKHKPDVITMDVEMPVMDGITAVQKIMDLVPTPILTFYLRSLKILLVTNKKPSFYYNNVFK